MATSSSALDPTALPSQFLWPLRALFWTVVVSACLWAACVAAQMSWALHRAPDDPIAYTDRVLSADLHEAARQQPPEVAPTAITWQIGNEIKTFVFDFMGGFVEKLFSMPKQMNAKLNRGVGTTSPPGPTAGTGLLSQSHVDRLMLAMTASYIFAVRTALFIAAVPMALLVYFVSVADGLAARSTRRACAGRESSSLYHRGKLTQAFLLSTCYVGFLVQPQSIDPLLLLVPLAVACGLLARLQVAFYKKYL